MLLKNKKEAILSYSCKTALKAVIYLACKTETGENQSLKDIAIHIGANGHTVGKMLQTLVKRGIIHSMKGPSGGFYVDWEQQQMSLMNIIDAIDGMAFFTECGLGLSSCSKTHPCPIHEQYMAPRVMLESLFRNARIIDLCQPVNQGFVYLKN